MKHVSNITSRKSIIRTVSIFAFTLVLLSLTSIKSYATDSTQVIPVTIKYIGSQYSVPVFQISLNNDAGEKVFVSLLDEEGNVLYTDISKGKTYQRNIQFDRHDWESLQLTIVLSGKNLNQKQAFTINKNQRTVQDVLVAKL